MLSVAFACNPPYEVSCDAESFQHDDNDDTDYQTESGVEDDLTLGVRSVDHFMDSKIVSTWPELRATSRGFQIAD